MLDNPVVAKYVVGWGQRGDLGVLAIDAASGQAVGAAWLRLFSGDDPAFGYLDDATPEMAIAVLPGFVGRGIGTQLLKHVLDLAGHTMPPSR